MICGGFGLYGGPEQTMLLSPEFTRVNKQFTDYIRENIVEGV
jgi:hypothetical protein